MRKVPYLKAKYFFFVYNYCDYYFCLLLLLLLNLAAARGHMLCTQIAPAAVPSTDTVTVTVTRHHTHVSLSLAPSPSNLFFNHSVARVSSSPSNPILKIFLQWIRYRTE